MRFSWVGRDVRRVRKAVSPLLIDLLLALLVAVGSMGIGIVVRGWLANDSSALANSCVAVGALAEQLAAQNEELIALLDEPVAPEVAQNNKITICHMPPGNPDNRRTISIDESAWPAHEAHGDSRGACAPLPPTATWTPEFGTIPSTDVPIDVLPPTATWTPEPGTIPPTEAPGTIPPLDVPTVSPPTASWTPDVSFSPTPISTPMPTSTAVATIAATATWTRESTNDRATSTPIIATSTSTAERGETDGRGAATPTRATIATNTASPLSPVPTALLATVLPVVPTFLPLPSRVATPGRVPTVPRSDTAVQLAQMSALVTDLLAENLALRAELAACQGSR